MKVYIAAPYQLRADAIRAKHQLQVQGFDVTSTWLTLPDKNSDAFARQDLDDIAAADAVVALNPPGWENRGTGGRHVEFGYALGLGKHVVLVGVRSNIFHHLTQAHLCDTVDTAGSLLRALAPEAVDRESPTTLGAG